jgi:iron complex outermembrane receptor protein
VKRSSPKASRLASAPGSLFRLSPVAAGATALFLAAGAAAQTTGPSTQPAAGSDTQTITVTGIRRGIENAINVKKNSDSIVEAISAEDIGKLPDTSVAESISRLPGVAAQRTQGRAQQISIRGLAPDFSTGLLNGREQVSTGDSRGVEFDQYPSELLSAVVIYKTPDAGLLGQGLAGTVDLQTIRPLDVSGRQFAINYRKQKTGVGLDKEGDGYRFSLAYVDQFADRKLGIALGFARLDETGAQTSRFEAWGVADSQVNGAGPTVKTPGGFNDFLDQTTQTRDGAMAVLQFRPNKAFSSTLDLFYSKFERNKLTQGFQAPVGFSSAGGYDPGGTLTTATVANGVATSGTFDNFKGVVRTDQEETKDTLKSIGWKNEYNFEDWKGTLDLYRSNAKRTGTIVETTAGLPGNGNAGGQVDTISWTGFDGTNVAGPSYSTGLDYTDRNIIRLTDVQGWGGGNALPQAGYSKLPRVEDELTGVRLSGKKSLGEGGFFSAADFGLNLTKREKTRAYVEGRLVIKGSVDLQTGAVSDPYASAPIPGTGTFKAGTTGIPLAAWQPAALLGSVYDVAPKLVRDIANKDWKVKEDVTTLYTKWDIDTELSKLPVTGNIGVQVVHTDQSSTAFNVDGQACPGDVCPVTTIKGGKKYTDVLPSVNLAVDLGGDQKLRLGYGLQIARANINDMRASFGFGVNTSGTFPILKGDAGNPELKPFKANAIDLAYEKYFGTKAYFGAALFHKDLRTYVVRQETPFDFTPYVTPGVTPLPTSGPFQDSPLGLLTQPVNGSGGTLTGLEFAASMPFNLLTPALDGFGAFASYANTTSSVSLPTTGFNTNGEIATPVIPLPGLSKEVYNIGVYFEKWGFSARVAQRSRSDFIGDVTNIFGDRSLTYVKGERVIDLQLGYEVQSGPAKGLSILFQASNLNNAPYIRYRDTPSNQIENTKYGKTYLFGLNYKL